MKTVYQCDENGYYIGETTADESPLEPGVYLVPAGAVEREPPEVAEGKRARHTGKKWVTEDIPSVAEPTAEQLLAQAVANRSAAYRLEADPLKNEADFDALESGEKADYSAWVAKVKEIKERFPLPVVS